MNFMALDLWMTIAARNFAALHHNFCFSEGLKRA
jgi:hypothetical protein